MKASKFMDAQKAFILKQGADGHPVAEICRKAGISEATFYNCRKKYGLLLPSEMKRLPELRRCPSQVGRGRHRSARLCASLLQGHPACAPEALLPGLRDHRPGPDAILPIERGKPGPGLLAHVLVSKYADNLPLYRQSEIYAREGVNLEHSTLADWVGRSAALLVPLVEVLRRDILSSAVLHGDDTQVPVLAAGLGKTRTGRLWTYVGDGRPHGSSQPSAAVFFYSPDRKGEHPQKHFGNFTGVLHADGYAGFNAVFESGTVTEAAC